MRYYKNVFNWLTVYTPGGRFKKGAIQNCHNKMWQPIRELWEMIVNQENRTEEEEIFSKHCSYYGSTFIVRSDSLEQRKFINEGKPAICVFGMLVYLFTYKKDFIDNQI